MTTRMRPFKETISLDEARAIIERAIEPMARIERVPLERASGRVLAETVTSSVDVPPFARAAMDGYAVRAEDTSGASRTASSRCKRSGPVSASRSQPARRCLTVPMPS